MNMDFIDKADLFASIKNELDDEQKRGTLLTVNGQIRSPEYIAGLCVFCEDCNYMRDYITDDDGNIIEIGFNDVHNN